MSYMIQSMNKFLLPYLQLMNLAKI